MAQEVYGNFEFSPKAYTRGNDIGKGQVGIPNVNPPFFLELRLIKGHTHTGVDSLVLSSDATPQMLKGYTPRERVERGTAQWTGGAAASGSVALTYGTAFLSAPTVLVIAAGQSTAYVNVTVGTPTTTGVTIYWRDLNGTTHTSVDLAYIIMGK